MVWIPAGEGSTVGRAAADTIADVSRSEFTLAISVSMPDAACHVVADEAGCGDVLGEVVAAGSTEAALHEEIAIAVSAVTAHPG